jgi:uncharacterized membrane protein
MRLWPLLLVVYALTTHLSVTYGYPLPAALLLATLLAASLLRALLARDLGSLLFLGVYGLATLAMFEFAGLYGMLFLPPVAINFAVASFFGRTLLPGQTDLITRIALQVRADRSPRVLRYTRRVSWSWMWFCLGMALLSAVLAMEAPLEVWSLFANFFNYLLLAAFFLAEVALRHIVLRGEPKSGLRDTLRAVSQMNFRRTFLA